MFLCGGKITRASCSDVMVPTAFLASDRKASERHAVEPRVLLAWSSFGGPVVLHPGTTPPEGSRRFPPEPASVLTQPPVTGSIRPTLLPQGAAPLAPGRNALTRAAGLPNTVGGKGRPQGAEQRINCACREPVVSRLCKDWVSQEPFSRIQTQSIFLAFDNIVSWL